LKLPRGTSALIEEDQLLRRDQRVETYANRAADARRKSYSRNGLSPAVVTTGSRYTNSHNSAPNSSADQSSVLE